MRIALLSDIHGNSIALDAVLADIEACGGVDAYWILGDLAALGHDPVGVLERLNTLPNVRICRGNTDRYVCTSDRPPPTMAEAMDDPTLIPILSDVAGTFAWTQGMVTAAGWFDWLSALPIDLRTDLPGGTRLLGIHASPGQDDIGIYPSTGEAEIESLLDGCQADLIITGHTHIPLDIELNGQRVVNCGSISNPLPPDLRASYIILEAGNSSYRLAQRFVDYDREAVVNALRAIGHPGADYIVKILRGQIKP